MSDSTQLNRTSREERKKKKKERQTLNRHRKNDDPSSENGNVRAPNGVEAPADDLIKNKATR